MPFWRGDRVSRPVELGRAIGKLSRLSNLVLAESQLDEYFEVLDRERRRAWRKYGMLVLAGIEFNKDGLTKKSSAHLLGIGMEMPVASALDLPETIAQLHAQGALAVASGQAASTFAVLNLARAGDNIVSSTDLYGGTWNLFANTLKDLGIEVRFVGPDRKSTRLNSSHRT